MKRSVELYKCRVCGNIASGAHVPDMTPIESYCDYFKDVRNATFKQSISACTINPEDHIGIADLVGWRSEWRNQREAVERLRQEHEQPKALRQDLHR